MFKLNNKGFAISGLFYGMLILFLFLLTSILSILTSGKKMFDKSKQNILNSINNQNIRISIDWYNVKIPLGYVLTEEEILYDVKVMDNDMELDTKINYEANYVPDTVGNYEVTYMAVVAGKTLKETRKIKVIAPSIYEFAYSGNVKNITLEKGIYKLEVWGAQGGYRSSTTYGGKGGYSAGTINLLEDTNIYISVGGSGNTGGVTGGFNGGGARTNNLPGGGGATDIRINEDSFYARVIVAGGGGSDGATNKTGMYGGGTDGGTTTESYGTGGGGATQIAGGAGGSGNSGTFGTGGNGLARSSGYGGAGGGGWYGGGGAYPDGGGDDDRGGGGGSGWIYNESTYNTWAAAVGSTEYSKWKLTSKYYLTDTTLLGGNITTIPTYDGTSTMTGNSGDGYAKITQLTFYPKYDYDPNYKDLVLNGADPELDSGMIPVLIDDDGTVKKADIEEKWYDYENKRWANVVLVSSDVRDSYEVGDPIPEEKILAYFVWVPRYKYKLFNTENGSIIEQEIEIVFENKETTKSNGSTNGTWLTHPAFTFGNIETGGVELNGIWVGKFETSHITLSSSTTNNNLGCTNESCENSDGLRIIPKVASLRYNNVSNMFYASRSMSKEGNTFGIDNQKYDTHMMKNTEWGAVSYLTQSKYGRCEGETCTEVSINNSNTCITGNSGGSPAVSYNGAKYSYNTTEGYLASTTGNITGIYDMNGGAYEYVMGNMKDESGNFYSRSAGFSNPPESKYYDSYANDSSSTSHGRGLLGDATRETLKTFGSDTGGWYSDSASFPGSTSSWFNRGGNYNSGVRAGVFYFGRGSGGGGSGISWRVTVHKQN